MTSRILLAVLLALYATIALLPFRFDVPGYVTNGLERRDERVWRFADPSLAITRMPPSWLDDVRRSAAITVNLTVRSERAVQTGPARILTISEDFLSRNLSVMQNGGDLVVRLRRTGSDDNGEPAFIVDDVFAEPEWQEIAVDVRPRHLEIRIGEVPVLRDRLPPDALAQWRSSFALALGNEVIGERPWVGEIAAATITTPSGSEDDLLASGRMEVPDGWWHVPRRLRAVAHVDGWTDVGVAALHLVAFVPIGYLLAISSRPMSRLLVRAAGISLTLEVLKVFVAGRHPSLFNAVTQVLGGLLGMFVLRSTNSPGRLWPGGRRAP